MCKIWACKQHRHRYAFCAGRLFTSFCCFLLLLFLTMNPIIWLHITLFSTAALKTETVFCNNARVCVHCVCRGYQLCVCCAVPNEHIRPGVCQRLSVTNCRLVYSEWQQRACGRQTHTHTVSDMQTETMVVALPWPRLLSWCLKGARSHGSQSRWRKLARRSPDFGLYLLSTTLPRKQG